MTAYSPRAAHCASSIVLTCLLLFNSQAASAELPLPFARTEERAPCADYDPQKRPFFGDLHVHTAYSFDSYISSQRNDPWDAYRYAKGEAITLPAPDAEQKLIARIQRPLDFTAVTDHAEFLGEVNACTDGAWSRKNISRQRPCQRT